MGDGGVVARMRGASVRLRCRARFCCRRVCGRCGPPVRAPARRVSPIADLDSTFPLARAGDRRLVAEPSPRGRARHARGTPRLERRAGRSL